LICAELTKRKVDGEAEAEPEAKRKPRRAGAKTPDTTHPKRVRRTASSDIID